MFGKNGRARGRPAEDAFARKYEIFRAVAPLILEKGARCITMREAAHAANLSLGGIYHYFQDKRALLLFPLSPEVCAEHMKRLLASLDHLRETDPHRYLEAIIDSVVETAILLRPAIQAALDIGGGEAWKRMEQVIEGDAGGFVTVAQAIDPRAARHDPDRLARALNRQFLATLLDRHASAEELKDIFFTILHGQPLGASPVAQSN